MTYLLGSGLAGLLACALGSVSCVMSHSCTDLAPTCDQTGITLQSPHDAWTAGMYTLALNVDGASVQCTLQIPVAPASSVEGTCSSTTTRFTLTQLCPQPVTVCDNNACTAMASGANCLSNQFQIDIIVSHAYEPGAEPKVASKVGLALSVDGRSVISETIAPKAITTEPNGAGCGICTNASATVAIT